MSNDKARSQAISDVELERRAFRKSRKQKSTLVAFISTSQRSVYYSNRAHVHLLLANNGHALADAEAAIALDANNVKVGAPIVYDLCLSNACRPGRTTRKEVPGV